MRTEQKLAEICDTLRINYGDFHAACRQNGLSTDFVTKWMKDDKVAAEQITEARRLGFMSLEGVAIDRAVHGHEKSIYHKGEVVGVERTPSDSLLVKIMEARIPEYSKRDTGGNVFNAPVQFNVIRATSYEEWLGMKEVQAAADKKDPALNAPTPQILEGVFTIAPRHKCLEGLL